jgi:transcriptional regulator with XRE-family HTH domain
MNLYDHVFTLCHKRNLTQQAFADLTDIHVEQIKRYEANTSQEEKSAARQWGNPSWRTNPVPEIAK